MHVTALFLFPRLKNNYKYDTRTPVEYEKRDILLSVYQYKTKTVGSHYNATTSTGTLVQSTCRLCVERITIYLHSSVPEVVGQATEPATRARYNARVLVQLVA